MTPFVCVLQMHVRMTGCPNGCARPYTAEVGLVGDGPNSYQLWLGGSANQTRLAEVYMERMKMQVCWVRVGRTQSTLKALLG